MLPNTNVLDEIRMVSTTGNMPPLGVEYLHRDVTVEEANTIQQQTTQPIPQRRASDREIVVLSDDGSNEDLEAYDPNFIMPGQQPVQPRSGSSTSLLGHSPSDDEAIGTTHSLPLPSTSSVATMNIDPGPSCSYQMPGLDIHPSQGQSSSDESVEEAGESSSTASHLTSSETGGDIKEWKCRHCDYDGQTKRRLRYHLSYHHGLRLNYKPLPITEFPCDQCNYVAKRRDLLKRHQRIHMTEAEREPLKRFSCPLCSRKFDRADHLKKHMNSHKK